MSKFAKEAGILNLDKVVRNSLFAELEPHYECHRICLFKFCYFSTLLRGLGRQEPTKFVEALRHSNLLQLYTLDVIE